MRSGLAGRARRQLTVLTNPSNRGKGFSVHRGFVDASGDWIVFNDADLTYPMSNLDAMVTVLAAGADVAYGSRLHPDRRYLIGPEFFGRFATRHLAGRLFNRAVRTALLPGVLDTQAGFKGFRRDAARELAMRVRLDRFSFDVEMLFAARRLGMRMEPCPVQFIYRNEPSTVRFVRDSLGMLYDIARVRWRGFRGRYDPVTPLPVAGESAARTMARSDADRRTRASG